MFRALRGTAALWVGLLAADGLGEVLAKGLHEVAPAQAHAQERGAGARVVQGREQGHAVAEGLVEGVHLEERRVPQVGSHRVEQAVADLVGHHVGARAGVATCVRRVVASKNKKPVRS